MKIRQIDLNNLNPDNIIKQYSDRIFYKNDKMLDKIFFSTNNLDSNQNEELKGLETRLEKLEKMGIEKISGVCEPIEKLYYNNDFQGYSTKYLNFFDTFYNSIDLFDNKLKLSLLIQLSKIIKDLHKIGIAHNDAHEGNILTNGKTLKLIDFDRADVFDTTNKTTYFCDTFLDFFWLKTIVSDTLKSLTINNNKSKDFNNIIDEYIQYTGVNYQNSNTMTIIYPHQWLEEIKEYVKR